VCFGGVVVLEYLPIDVTLEVVELPEVGVFKKVQTEPVLIDEVVLVTAALALDLLLEEVVVE